MAWQDFYIQQTASDLNSGSTVDDSPSLTSTGGTITAGTTGLTRFTAASNNTFTASHLNKWASLYATGDTAAQFVGTVQAYDTTNGAWVDLSNDKMTGTSLTCLGKADLTTASTGLKTAGNANLRIGGAWASLAITNTGNAMALPYLASTGTAVLTMRVNIKYAASAYSYSANIAIAAAAIARGCTWRGYYATPGDLDDLPKVSGAIAGGLIRPTITMTSTATMTINAYNYWENFDFVAVPFNAAGVILLPSYCRFYRCRFIHSGGALNYVHISSTSPFTTFTYCYFQGSGSSVSTNAIGGCGQFICPMFYNIGGRGITLINGGPSLFYFPIFDTCGYGIVNNVAGYGATIINPSSYNCINLFGAAQNSSINIINANISESTGIGISQSNLSSALFIAGCNFYNNTGGHWPNRSLAGTTIPEDYVKGCIFAETASPYVSAASHDFTLKSTSLARLAGIPGQFEVP